MQGGRKLSNWNLFVKKIYKEGKAKNADYAFKQALSDASKRKSEMGTMKLHTKPKKSKRRSVSMAMAGGKSKRRSVSMAGGKSKRRKY
jgi:ribosomal protein S11